MRYCLDENLDVITWLERKLDSFDKILLFTESSLLDMFCESKIVQNTDRKILLLVIDKVEIDTNHFNALHITKLEEEQLSFLYLTYEFGEHFNIISRDNKFFGNIKYLIDAGFISEEEYFQVIMER